jgi:peptidoglycan/xylan/chitin deacetylase (PgdA/CDA1 family)
MSPARPKPARLVLKVDVDTLVGLERGVPRLLEIFDGLGVSASFFVAMGPDHSGRALRRLVRPGFLAKQLRSGATGAYGLRTMLYGVLLPGPVIARSAPGRLREVLAAGHELGLHGWDHVFWHDRLRGLEPGRVRVELARARNLFADLTGLEPAAFAAPGWQIDDKAFLALESLGITHASCTRGAHPFRPVVAGRALGLLELPTTLPTLDELMGRGEDPARAARRLAELVRPGLNVFTLHAEVEGRALAGELEGLLRRLQGRGVEFPRLVDAARQEAEGAPAGRAGWGRVAERAYEVALQEEAGA